MDHLFNSLDSAYKTPRGAVRAGEPLRLALTIPEHYGFVEPRLVLTKDGGAPVDSPIPKAHVMAYLVQLNRWMETLHLSV